MLLSVSNLLAFYKSFWGRCVQSNIHPYWQQSVRYPSLALGFCLPWQDSKTLYAIPKCYGGQGVVWPEGERPCQTILVDPLHLPVGDHGLHTVWAIHMMEVLTDDWLCEMDRVLARDGQLHIVVARSYHPLTCHWPMLRTSRKTLRTRLSQYGWYVRVQGIMGWPPMLLYAILQRRPYHIVRRVASGHLVGVDVPQYVASRGSPSV